MTARKVSEMTMAELESLIVQTVDAKLKLYSRPIQPLNSTEVMARLDAIARRRWTPPSGTSKASQLILAEREQWRQGLL